MKTLCCRRCGSKYRICNLTAPFTYWFCYRADDGSYCGTMNVRKDEPMQTPDPTDPTAVIEGGATKILERARELISDPRHWTQRLYAKTARGYPCNPGSQEAACWCLLGALYRAMVECAGESPVALAWINTHEKAFDHIRKIVEQWGYPSIPSFNDNAEHHHVLQVLDLAIANSRNS